MENVKYNPLAIDKIVTVCIEKEKLDKALEAARLGAGTRAVNALVAAYIEKGNLDEAVKTARLINRQLTADEVEKVIAHCIGQYPDEALRAIRLNKREPTAEEIKRLIVAYIKKNLFNDALLVAKRGTEKETVNVLISACVDKGDFDTALKAVKLSNRQLTKDEIDKLVFANIKKGLLDSALKIAEFGAGVEAINTLVSIYIEKERNETYTGYTGEMSLPNWLEDAVKIAKFRADERMINALINISVDMGKLNCALNAAEILKRKLTNEEIEKAVSVWVEKGHADVALEIAKKYNNRPLTAEELDKSIAICIETGDLDEALKTAKLANRQLTKSEIEKLIAILVEQKWQEGIPSMGILGMTLKNVIKAAEMIVS